MTLPATAPAPVLAHCELDAAGGTLAGSDPDRVFYAASTIKLGVLIAVLREVDAGRIGLADPLISAHRFASRVPGAPEFGFTPEEIDHGMPAPGETVSVALCLDRMIRVSSNEATNLLVGLVGLDAVTAAFGGLGAGTARMTRLIGDYAARELGFSHEASPRDLAVTVLAIWQGRALSPASTALAVELLSSQEFPVIAAALPAGSRWGSKSGWVVGIEHDVAAVGEPGSDAVRVLAVCSEGFGSAEAGQAAIRALAAERFPAA